MVLFGVMLWAEVGQVVMRCLAIVLPFPGVIEIASRRGATAPRFSAGAVSQAEPLLQISRHRVSIAADRQHNARLRVGQDAHPACRAPGQPTGGLEIDRTVAVEARRLDAFTEKRQNGNRDSDGCANGGAGMPDARTVEQQLGREIDPALGKRSVVTLGARLGRFAGTVVNRVTICGREVEMQPDHAIPSIFDRQLAVDGRLLVTLGDGRRVHAFTRRARLSFELRDG